MCYIINYNIQYITIYNVIYKILYMIIFENVKILISFGKFFGYWGLVYLCTELLNIS